MAERGGQWAFPSRTHRGDAALIAEHFQNRIGSLRRVDVFRAKERMPVQHSAQMIPFQSKGAFGAAILPFFPQAVDNVHTIAAILAHGFDGKKQALL
jgi:hypothetical protein